MAKKFKYTRRSAKSVEARAHQGASSRDGFIKNEFKMFSPKAGDNVLRILPPTWENADHYGFDVYVNYGVGPDNAAYASLSKMLAQADPIAEERDRALSAGDEEYAKSLRPSKRVLFWVIDRTKEEEGPMLWASPWTVDRDLSLLCRDKRTGEILYVDDPYDGYDIEFTKTGTGMTTKYEGLLISRRSSPLNADEAVQDKWLEYISENPLPETILYYDYDYIKRVFEGGGSKSGSASSDAAKPSSNKPSKSALTFEELCGMSLQELDAVCEENKVNLFADDFGSSEEMAAAICEALGIDVPEKKPARTRSRVEEPKDEASEDEGDSTDDDDSSEEEEEEEKEEEKSSSRKSRLAGLRRR